MRLDYYVVYYYAPILVGIFSVGVHSKNEYTSKTKVRPNDNDAIYQNEFLQAHNKYRAKHGSVPMKLNDELNRDAEYCAYYYASKRSIDKHDCPAPGKSGENLYAIWVSGGPLPNRTYVVENSVQLWYEEIKYYDFDNPGRHTGVIGHFTQVIWNASTELGLGIASYDKYTVVVGKYRPPGNVHLFGGGDQYKRYRENVLRSKSTRVEVRLIFVMLFLVGSQLLPKIKLPEN